MQGAKEPMSTVRFSFVGNEELGVGICWKVPGNAVVPCMPFG